VKILAVAIALVSLLTGSITVSAARVWIDDPLPESVHPVAPVQIVAHAFDEAGVASVTFSVDGDVIAEITPAGAGNRFVTVRAQWDPPGPGIYLLQVRGLAPDETGGAAASAVIEIEGPPPPSTTTTVAPATTQPTTTTQPATTTSTTSTSTTTTTTSTTSTTTTTTSTSTTTTSTSTTTTSTTAPTTTTTSCDLGVPTPTGPSGTVTNPSPTLTWSYNGCREPMEFEIQVSRDSTFTRVEYPGMAPGDVRSFPVGPLACDTWYWQIRTLDPDTGPFSGVASFTVAGPDC